MPTGGDMSWQGGWDSMVSVKAPRHQEPVVQLKPVIPRFLRAAGLTSCPTPSNRLTETLLKNARRIRPDRSQQRPGHRQAPRAHGPQGSGPIARTGLPAATCTASLRRRSRRTGCQAMGPDFRGGLRGTGEIGTNLRGGEVGAGLGSRTGQVRRAAREVFITRREGVI